MAYDKDFKDEVVAWMSGGRSANEAKHHFGIAHGTASRWYNEHMASIVVLAEPEAWEEIARWWDEPRGEESNFGLCHSVTCLSNKMSISKGTSDTMHARITLLCKKRRKTDNWLYPEGENRAARAAIARRFAKDARRELGIVKSDEVPETIFDSNTTDFPEDWACFANQLRNPEPRKPRIFVDLDGVLADFNSKAERILNTKDIHKWEFVHGAESFWNALDKDPNLFRDLKPMPEAWQLWTGIVEILGEKPTILTAVPNTDTHDAAAQKRDWCKKYLGEDVEVITCSIEGKAAYCNPDDILIDDRAIYRKDWEAKGGKFLLYGEWLGTGSAEFCLARLKNMVSGEKSLIKEV